MRSFLTLLGVIIGVMTVVSVVSVISGLNNYIEEKVFRLSPDVFVVTRWGIITSREEFLEALKRKNLTKADAAAVERSCQSCAMVGTYIRSRQPVKYGRNKFPGAAILGTSSNMAELNNLDLETGRFYTPSEEQHSAEVAVIGSDLRDELFGKLDPVGRMVTISGRKVKVIGLLVKQGRVLGETQDDRVYIPISTFGRFFGARRTIDIFVRPEGGVPAVKRAQDEVRVILRSRRHTPFKAEDPFAMVTAEALQNVWKNISATAFAFMVLISGISLIVGGIVIMNIMLVSVVERTREIGIRRALGARRRDILWQFFAEAILLAVVGGATGVALGALIAKVIATLSPLPTLVRPSLVVTGLVIAATTGALAGFFPARRAAKLVPVEALRYE